MAMADRDVAQDAIARGTSTVLPQREHLIAQQAKLEAANRALTLLGEVIATVMLEHGVPVMGVPAERLRAVRATRSCAVVQPTKDGSVVVRLIVLAPESRIVT